MKKIISAVILCLMFVPLAQAATIYSQNDNTFNENERKVIFPIVITADTSAEITAKNGINLILPDYQSNQILWDNVPTLTAYGTAVDNKKIAANISVQYLNTYSVLHIPVLADFAAGENVTLSGMTIRAYHYSFGSRYIGLDINGDYVADFQDVNRLQVLGTIGGDTTPPYPPTNFTATLSADAKSVSLNWVRPPDFDLAYMILDRKITRGGNTSEVNVFDQMNSDSYVDMNIKAGDVITYELYASDSINFSDKVDQTVTVTAAVTPPVVTPPTTTPVGNPPIVVLPPATPQTELDELNRLYGYYKVRYAIKCRTGVSANDSACLWAKIDIVYTQDKISKTDVKASLSAKEIGYIQYGLKWAQARYQTSCVDAKTPEKFCDALNNALNRANYFIK